MYKMRVTLWAALALLAVGGIATSAASAAGPYWHVGGSRLEKGSKAETLKAGPTELKAKVLSLAFTIKCTAATVEGAEITGNGTSQGQDKASAIAFEKCTITVPKGCVVPQPIRTASVKSHLVKYGAEKIGDLFEPTKGTAFVTIKFENESKTNTCSVKGEFPVKGTIAAELKPEGVEASTNELVFPGTPIEEVKKEGGEAVLVGLEIGESNPANFNGSFEVALVSGENFGVFAT